MKRIIVAAAAAGLLVAGAFVASTITSDVASAQVGEFQAEEAEGADRPERGAHLDEVLAGLVSDGTIDQSQADAVKVALQAKADEVRADREERRDERRATREIVREMLDDDVIDSSELSELGDDHPFNNPDGVFADAAADGQITKDELEGIREDHGGRRGPGTQRGQGASTEST